MAGKVSVVVGGQFGSEAKGAVAGYLASSDQNRFIQVVCVRVGGPNAGHTVYGRCPQGCEGHTDHLGFGVAEPHPWRLRQVPVAAVTNPDAELLIAAGSEVDFDVLLSEVRALNSAGYEVNERLWLDQSATVLERHHIETEQAGGLTQRLGSTAKGIGAARSDRIWRMAKTVGEINLQSMCLGYSQINGAIDGAKFLSSELWSGAHVVIEGTQGYGLGLHTKYYPQTTSGDCRAIDFLAQTGISPWSFDVSELDVWVVVRTHPIRVAGNSGPMKGELSWDELGVPEERTTVTQKVRRVGEWDPELVRAAVDANGGRRVKLALTMADYVIPEIEGTTELPTNEVTINALDKLMDSVEQDAGTKVLLVGTSPTTIIDLR